MSQISLTELSIKAIKGTDTTRTYWDALPGFGVRVGKRSKTYIVMRGKTRERVRRIPTNSYAQSLCQ